MKSRALHAISFDVEEFFQVANLRGHFRREDWDQVASRLDVGMDAVLSALEQNGARATMFFLGWIAERRPDLVLTDPHNRGHAAPVALLVAPGSIPRQTVARPTDRYCRLTSLGELNAFQVKGNFVS